MVFFLLMVFRMVVVFLLFVLLRLVGVKTRVVFFVRVMDQAGTSGFFDDLIAFAGARLLPDLIVPANSGTG
ncbi:MAG: hypothetical protein EOO03_16135, partial [Chitinophagaceae bacterium]